MPYNWLTEEEMIRALFTDGSACYTGTTHKWTAKVLRFLSGTIMKATSEGKSSHWAELSEIHRGMHFIWNEEMMNV